MRPDPKDTTGGYWETISSERQQLEEGITSYAVEFKQNHAEIGELITEVTGVLIDNDNDDLDACSLLSDEQLKAVADKCRQNEEPRSYEDDRQLWEFGLDAINEASAEAARLQGEYWDALRDLEESMALISTVQTNSMTLHLLPSPTRGHTTDTGRRRPQTKARFLY
jgi:hypothetical protein